MNYNEGWNVMFVARLLGGGPLYTPVDNFPLTPLNYPPLSYFIIGAFSRVTGDILLTGRLVTLFSTLLVAVMIVRIVEEITGRQSAGIFASLFWLALTASLAPARLVMYDPQMLAHVFSTCALWLFCQWREALSAPRLWLIALLCCISIFTKHLLIAVPVTIAAALFLEDRKAFRRFALAGVMIAAAAASAMLFYGGTNLATNFVDSGRPVENGRVFRSLRRIFIARMGLVVVAPFILLLIKPHKAWRPYLIYFGVSFAIAAYTCRGVGVDMNAWFDFFIAAAVLFGIAATTVYDPAADEEKSRAALVYAFVVLALLPLVLILPPAIGGTLRYRELRRAEAAYERQVALLRSIPGAALYESLLLGYDAGKEFLVEPFNVAQMIVMGRIPEAILTDAIGRHEFGAIVLDADLDEALCGASYLSFTALTRWTPRTLRSIAENYQPLDGERSPFYFYVPRTTRKQITIRCPTRRGESSYARP